MDWGTLEGQGVSREVLQHWRKLGQFRRKHPAVGAGVHRTLQVEPFIFSRTLEAGGRKDRVLVAMGVGEGEGARTIPVFGVFEDGVVVEDEYSGGRATVRNGTVSLERGAGVVLLGEVRSED